MADSTVGNGQSEEVIDHDDLVTKFGIFLQDEDKDGEYAERVRDMAENKQNRLIVDMDDLREFDPGLTVSLLARPLPFIKAFEQALGQIMNGLPQKEEYHPSTVFRVGFSGSFGSHQVSPRSLLANYLNALVSVEGIVTKLSLVKPKLVRSVHYCEATNKSQAKDYRDAYSLDGLPMPMGIPKQDEEGNPLQVEFGLSTFRDFQTMHIQEMPERAPLGQLPRSVEVVMESDIVDTCKPGDRVQVVGIYRAVVFGQGAGFKTVLFANTIQNIGTDIQALVMTPDDLANIRKIAKQPNVFSMLSRSLAPSIYGHEYIKKALLLLLLGGMEKNLDNGTHLRGDINILMVGDPSTAKSQLLRFVLGIAPLAISTTGRGSTGVGLTAAVTSDAETGEKRLEAGAMVLADRGVVCIDEFDKMGDADRVAIHEVMEQQTVTIAKAGIHASLNARCSVVAAANPLYGGYDKNLSPQRNVALPDSLLSRFDLLFIVLDNLNPDHDRAISDHVLRMHRYERPGHHGVPMPGFTRSSGSDGLGLPGGDGRPDSVDHKSPVFQKFNPLLHGGFAATGDGNRDELLSTAFLRKYIHYAKSRIRPVLTEVAQQFITEQYAKLRQGQEERTLPVTARQLETMIRLSSAHAKLRLSSEVEQIDCEQALEIMEFALYHETKRAGNQLNLSEPTTTDSKSKLNAAQQVDDDIKTQFFSAAKKRKVDDATGKGAEQEQLEPHNDENDEFGVNDGSSQVPIVARKPTLSRLEIFQKAVGHTFQTTRAESLRIEALVEAVNEKMEADRTSGGTHPAEQYKNFSIEEANEMLQTLDQDGKVFLVDGEVHSI